MKIRPRRMYRETNPRVMSNPYLGQDGREYHDIHSLIQANQEARQIKEELHRDVVPKEQRYFKKN